MNLSVLGNLVRETSQRTFVLPAPPFDLVASYPTIKQKFNACKLLDSQVKGAEGQIDLPRLKLLFDSYMEFLADYFQEFIGKYFSKEEQLASFSKQDLKHFRYFVSQGFTISTSFLRLCPPTVRPDSDATAPLTSLSRILLKWIMLFLPTVGTSSSSSPVLGLLICSLSYLFRIYNILKSLKLVEPLLTRLDSSLVGLNEKALFSLPKPISSPGDMFTYYYFRARIYIKDESCWPLAFSHFLIAFKILRWHATKKGLTAPCALEKTVFIYMVILQYLLRLSPPKLEFCKYYGFVDVPSVIFFVKRSSWEPPQVALEFDTLYFSCAIKAPSYFVLKVLKYWAYLDGSFFSSRIQYDVLFNVLIALSTNLGPSVRIFDSVEELEVILATMISNSLVKGYLSHEKRTLVLAKKNPFPK